MSLDAAHRAFDAGDFREARRLAAELRASAPDEPSRNAAEALLLRTDFDPLIVWITVGCLILFIAIVLAT